MHVLGIGGVWRLCEVIKKATEHCSNRTKSPIMAHCAFSQIYIKDPVDHPTLTDILNSRKTKTSVTITYRTIFLYDVISFLYD